MCDKEKVRNHEIMLHFTPKSANLIFNHDSEQAVSYRKENIYILYIKKLHVHHIKTMWFIHCYPQKCLLKSEQNRKQNVQYIGHMLAVCYLYKYNTFKIKIILHVFLTEIIIKPDTWNWHLLYIK